MYDPYLYFAITRDNGAGGAISILFSNTHKLRGARTWCPKRSKKFELHLWIKEVIKIKLSEGNFSTLKFSGRVTSIDVTIYLSRAGAAE